MKDVAHYSWCATPLAGVSDFHHRLTLLDGINYCLLHLSPSLTDTVYIVCGAKASLVVSCLPFVDREPSCRLHALMGCPVTISHKAEQQYVLTFTCGDKQATLTLVGLYV